MRAFTVRATGGTPHVADHVVAHTVADGRAVVVKDSDQPEQRKVVPVAPAAGQTDGDLLIVERASITKIDGSHQLIAERRQDRKRSRPDVLVFIDSGEIGRPMGCRFSNQHLSETVEERKRFRKPQLVEVPRTLCPTCSRILDEGGRHPVLDAPLSGFETTGVLVLATGDIATTGRALVVMRPDSSISVFDGTQTWMLAWDGTSLALEERVVAHHLATAA